MRALFLIIVSLPLYLAAEEPQESSTLLPTLLNEQEKPSVKHLTLPDGPIVSRQRLSLGINFAGAQARWNFSTRWAMEGRYQQGQASSDYGDVKAQVFGLRFYRFIHPERRLPLYWGSEMAYVTAKPESSAYKANGVAMGVFAGMQVHLTRRIFMDMDLGPYVISLTETHTHASATTLDFVLNTALVAKVF